jgi:predicted GTPase
LGQLAGFVTERGNPGNEKGLIEARVELPERFLRRGLHFIDTPGIGSARQENTATTYEFLPEADAVIFVTSVEAPLSAAEEDFLHEIRAQVRRLFGSPSD